MGDSFEKDGLHKVAAVGFSEASTYEKARPTYPIAAVDHLADSIKKLFSNKKPNEIKVIDLAAGTGKFTRLINQYGFDLVAVEPVDGMKNEFVKVLPDVKLISGTAQQLPFPNNSLDVVITAQAFHWFATLESLKEIHRVLVPGGMFALIWNLEDRNKAPWVAKLRDYYEQFEYGVPQYHRGIWKQCFVEDNHTLFSEIQDSHYAHSVFCTRHTICDRVLSKSYIACLPNEKKEQVIEHVFEILSKELPQLFQEEGKTIDYPYNTDLFLTIRK